MKHKNRFIAPTAVAAVVLIIAMAIGVQIDRIPGDILLTGKNTRVIDFGLPFSADIKSDAVDVLSFNGTSLKDVDKVDLSKPIELSPNESGSAHLSFSLLGIPIKNINVIVGSEVMLYPGGQSIGVLLRTDGALVVGSSDITDDNGKTVNPARDAGLFAGDVIKSVNGVSIENADHLSELVNDADDGALTLDIMRSGVKKSIEIYPALDASDGKYKLGVWVRDSTAGVGTLSFYEPSTGTFAGLGHAITDSDTGELLSVKDGEIIESRIIEIVKGYRGEPGELKGQFDPYRDIIGRIEKNSRFGIFGNSEAKLSNGIYSEPIAAASREDVHTGPATICCSPDGSGTGEYDCSIIRIEQQDAPEAKSFVIEITDQELLEKTGGIVQGMSGSPVIQDGKLIGAVTHVFVSDPTKGYGIYIDWMLNEIE